MKRLRILFFFLVLVLVYIIAVSIDRSGKPETGLIQFESSVVTATPTASPQEVQAAWDSLAALSTDPCKTLYLLGAVYTEQQILAAEMEYSVYQIQHQRVLQPDASNIEQAVNQQKLMQVALVSCKAAGGLFSVVKVLLEAPEPG